MKKAILLCALCASVVMTSGCASLINGYVQTQGDMRDVKTARAAALIPTSGSIWPTPG